MEEEVPGTPGASSVKEERSAYVKLRASEGVRHAAVGTPWGELTGTSTVLTSE